MLCTTIGCNDQAMQDNHRCARCIVTGLPTGHIRVVDHTAEALKKKVAEDAELMRQAREAAMAVVHPTADATHVARRAEDSSMADRYPKYYKKVPEGVTALDIYAVCQMFSVTDAALSHSLKKIMLPGARTGGKSQYDDIKEARDTLNRWLELNKVKP